MREVDLLLEIDRLKLLCCKLLHNQAGSQFRNYPQFPTVVSLHNTSYTNYDLSVKVATVMMMAPERSQRHELIEPRLEAQPSLDKRRRRAGLLGDRPATRTPQPLR